jgi:hypothetical protein
MDPATALTVAAISFIGVLVGGIITAGANFILAVRRERLEEKARERAIKIEVRRASRLILAELFTIQSVVSAALSKHKQIGKYPPLEIRSWQAHKSVLAPIMSNEAWSNMEIAYASISLLIAGIAMPDDPPTDQIPFYPVVVQTIEAATNQLRPYTEDEPPGA